MTETSSNVQPVVAINGSSSAVLQDAFRMKTVEMKHWTPLPDSMPSNRDRLELYALHRQALSGDAPPLSAQQSQGWNATERAKYQSWKSKAGLDAPTAMQQYLTEADRQMRVYGTSSSSQVPPSSSSSEAASTTPSPPVSRGLAAIPLLCAAASEPRPAYLRRIQTTAYAQAWWRRQEPLTAAPWTLLALPEHALLLLATLLETLSLGLTHRLPLPIAAALQSYLWPLHNTLLALWLGYILIHTMLRTALQMTATLLLGSRRTGHALHPLWHDEVGTTGRTVLPTLLERHQPLTVRLVGLLLWPYAAAVRALQHLGTGEPPEASVLLPCGIYAILMASTTWYWLFLVPALGMGLMGGLSVTVVGYCCAIMELASHL